MSAELKEIKTEMDGTEGTNCVPLPTPVDDLKKNLDETGEKTDVGDTRELVKSEKLEHADERTDEEDEDEEDDDSHDNSPLNYELQQGYRILKELMAESNKSVNWPFIYQVDDSYPETSDYYEKIKNPIWLEKMKEKFMKREYETITQFVSDFRLMLENCYRYNGPDHYVSKRGQKLETMMEQKLALLSREIREKTSIAATSGLAQRENSPLAGLRRRTRNITPHDSSALLNQLRVEEAQSLREARKQQMIERKAAQEAYLQELVDWENNMMNNRAKEMRAMWELPQIGLFLFLCQEPLNIGETSQFELERCFFMPKESSTMQLIMTSLLSTPFQRTRIDTKALMPYYVWNEKLKAKLTQWYKVFTDHNKDINKAADKLGLDPYFFEVIGQRNPLDKRKYHELSIYRRVWIMKSLCDWCLEHQESIRDTIEAQPAEEQRCYFLGVDAKGNSYVHFPQFCGADLRIYKQEPIPDPPILFTQEIKEEEEVKPLKLPKSPEKDIRTKKTAISTKNKKKKSKYPSEIPTPPTNRPSRLRQKIKTVLPVTNDSSSFDEEEDEDDDDNNDDDETDPAESEDQSDSTFNDSGISENTPAKRKGYSLNKQINQVIDSEIYSDSSSVDSENGAWRRRSSRLLKNGLMKEFGHIPVDEEFDDTSCDKFDSISENSRSYVVDENSEESRPDDKNIDTRTEDSTPVSDIVGSTSVSDIVESYLNCDENSDINSADCSERTKIDEIDAKTENLVSNAGDITKSEDKDLFDSCSSVDAKGDQVIDYNKLCDAIDKVMSDGLYDSIDDETSKDSSIGFTIDENAINDDIDQQDKDELMDSSDVLDLNNRDCFSIDIVKKETENCEFENTNSEKENCDNGTKNYDVNSGNVRAKIKETLDLKNNTDSPLKTEPNGITYNNTSEKCERLVSVSSNDGENNSIIKEELKENVNNIEKSDNGFNHENKSTVETESKCKHEKVVPNQEDRNLGTDSLLHCKHQSRNGASSDIIKAENEICSNNGQSGNVIETTNVKCENICKDGSFDDVNSNVKQENHVKMESESMCTPMDLDDSTIQNGESKQEMEEEPENEEEEITPQIGPFELIVEDVEGLRALVEQFAEQEPEVIGKGKKQKVIKPPPRRRCVKELYGRLLYLLKELEPWETKLIQAAKKARIKLKKEQENKDISQEVGDDLWKTDNSETDTDEEGSDEDDSGDELAEMDKIKQSAKTETINTSGVQESYEIDVSSRGRLRKRRVIPNNVAEDQAKKRKVVNNPVVSTSDPSSLNRPNKTVQSTSGLGKVIANIDQLKVLNYGTGGSINSASQIILQTSPGNYASVMGLSPQALAKLKLSTKGTVVLAPPQGTPQKLQQISPTGSLNMTTKQASHPVMQGLLSTSKPSILKKNVNRGGQNTPKDNQSSASAAAPGQGVIQPVSSQQQVITKALSGNQTGKVQYYAANVNSLPPAVLQHLVKTNSLKLQPGSNQSGMVLLAIDPQSASGTSKVPPAQVIINNQGPESYKAVPSISQFKNTIPVSSVNLASLTTQQTSHIANVSATNTANSNSVGLNQSILSGMSSKIITSSSADSGTVPVTTMEIKHDLTAVGVLKSVISSVASQNKDMNQKVNVLSTSLPPTVQTTSDLLVTNAMANLSGTVLTSSLGPVSPNRNVNKYASGVTVKSLLKAKKSAKKMEALNQIIVQRAGLLQTSASSIRVGGVPPANVPHVGANRSTVVLHPTTTGIKALKLPSKAVLDSAVQTVVTSVKTSLPTANIKVPSPVTMPSIQPRKNVTKTIQSMKAPIPTTPKVETKSASNSSTAEPAVSVTNLSNSDSFTINTGNQTILAQLPYGNNQYMLANVKKNSVGGFITSSYTVQGQNQKSLMLKLLPQNVPAGQSGLVQGYLAPQGLVISPPGSQQQKVEISPSSTQFSISPSSTQFSNQNLGNNLSQNKSNLVQAVNQSVANNLSQQKPSTVQIANQAVGNNLSQQKPNGIPVANQIAGNNFSQQKIISASTQPAMSTHSITTDFGQSGNSVTKSVSMNSGNKTLTFQPRIICNSNSGMPRTVTYKIGESSEVTSVTNKVSVINSSVLGSSGIVHNDMKSPAVTSIVTNTALKLEQNRESTSGVSVNTITNTLASGQLSAVNMSGQKISTLPQAGNGSQVPQSPVQLASPILGQLSNPNLINYASALGQISSPTAKVNPVVGQLRGLTFDPNVQINGQQTLPVVSGTQLMGQSHLQIVGQPIPNISHLLGQSPFTLSKTPQLVNHPVSSLPLQVAASQNTISVSSSDSLAGHLSVTVGSISNLQQSGLNSSLATTKSTAAEMKFNSVSSAGKNTQIIGQQVGNMSPMLSPVLKQEPVILGSFGPGSSSELIKQLAAAQVLGNSQIQLTGLQSQNSVATNATNINNSGSPMPSQYFIQVPSVGNAANQNIVRVQGQVPVQVQGQVPVQGQQILLLSSQRGLLPKNVQLSSSKPVAIEHLPTTVNNTQQTSVNNSPMKTDQKQSQIQVGLPKQQTSFDVIPPLTIVSSKVVSPVSTASSHIVSSVSTVSSQNLPFNKGLIYVSPSKLTDSSSATKSTGDSTGLNSSEESSTKKTVQLKPVLSDPPQPGHSQKLFLYNIGGQLVTPQGVPVTVENGVLKVLPKPKVNIENLIAAQAQQSLASNLNSTAREQVSSNCVPLENNTSFVVKQTLSSSDIGKINESSEVVNQQSSQPARYTNQQVLNIKPFEKQLQDHSVNPICINSTNSASSHGGDSVQTMSVNYLTSGGNQGTKRQATEPVSSANIDTVSPAKVSKVQTVSSHMSGSHLKISQILAQKSTVMAIPKVVKSVKTNVQGTLTNNLTNSGTTGTGFVVMPGQTQIIFPHANLNNAANSVYNTSPLSKVVQGSKLVSPVGSQIRAPTELMKKENLVSDTDIKSVQSSASTSVHRPNHRNDKDDGKLTGATSVSITNSTSGNAAVSDSLVATSIREYTNIEAVAGQEVPSQVINVGKVLSSSSELNHSYSKQNVENISMETNSVNSNKEVLGEQEAALNLLSLANQNFGT